MTGAEGNFGIISGEDSTLSSCTGREVILGIENEGAEGICGEVSDSVDSVENAASNSSILPSPSKSSDSNCGWLGSGIPLSSASINSLGGEGCTNVGVSEFG